MGLRVVQISVDTAGSAGSAVGTGYSSRPVSGEVRALKVDYSASAPAGTTDVTVTFESDDDQPEVTIYSKSNSATDAWV